jgi:hypothetical protein
MTYRETYSACATYPPPGKKRTICFLANGFVSKNAIFLKECLCGRACYEATSRNGRNSWQMEAILDFVLRALHLAFTHFIINLTALAIARFTLNHSLQFVSNAAPEQGRLHCVAHSVINHFRALLAASH